MTIAISLNNILFENIHFTYTITGFGDKLITYINPAPQSQLIKEKAQF